MNLSKLFRRKSHPKPARAPAPYKSAASPPQPIVKLEAKEAHSPPPILQPPPRPRRKRSEFNDVEMLDSIVAFFRKYLVCDDYQFTILALWIVHTWCCRYFPTAAYLNIQSAEPESGKSRCLELLNLLCHAPWFASGPSPKTVMAKLLNRPATKETNNDHGPPCTMILDDCHHVFGRSERQELLAMLNSGIRSSLRYARGDSEYCLFGPKAFAANASLPRSLAARCLNIMLKRKKPSENVGRFHPQAAAAAAANIVDWLGALANEPEWIIQKVNHGPPVLPARVLTARELDCAEPLLLIADAIGGSWPQKARAAVIACSKLVEGSESLMVLKDVRLWFFIRNDPEYFLTRDLLPLLGGMENRPWAAWSKNSGKRLGKLLKRYGIFSRNMTNGSEKNLKGYVLKDFKDSWERYLQPWTAEEIADRDSMLANKSAP